MFWFQREKRFEPPFVLYAGRRRVGKTLMAVDREFLGRTPGRDFYANIDLVDSRDGYCAGRIYDWSQLSELEDCIVLIDEVNLWANSDAWNNIEDGTYTRWAQSGHHGLGLVMTSHSTARFAKQLRELVDDVFLCRRHPLRDMIDSRMPYVHYVQVDNIEAADRVISRDLEAPVQWGTHHVSSLAYDSYSTEEDQAMQVSRASGQALSEIPIRHPYYDPSRIKRSGLSKLFRPRGAEDSAL